MAIQTEPSHRVRELFIRQVQPGDEHDLRVLFAGLDTRWFRPHDLGAAGASEVATHVGKDAYLIGLIGSIPVAYGMLRGWDEGYRVPALGIAIREGFRDRGLGRRMMHALHRVVRERGGHRVRLRVAEGNARARHLYKSLGYRKVGGRAWRARDAPRPRRLRSRRMAASAGRWFLGALPSRLRA